MLCKMVICQAAGIYKGSIQGRNLSDNWGGECLFMYSCYARRISFEINSNSKEIRRAEHELYE